jgi:hypothetical protein
MYVKSAGSHVHAKRIVALPPAAIAALRKPPGGQYAG